MGSGGYGHGMTLICLSSPLEVDSRRRVISVCNRGVSASAFSSIALRQVVRESIADLAKGCHSN